MLENTDVTSADNRSGVTRRSVVRAGATAAWTVPLVTVATASPALAVSPGNAALQINGYGVRREPAKQSLWIDIDAIRNKGTGPSGQVTATFRVPKSRGALSAAPTLIYGPGAGWSFAGRSGDGPWDFTFVSDTGVESKRWTKPLKFRLKLANNEPTPQVNITVVASAPGAQSAADSRPMRWVKVDGGGSAV